MIGKNTISLNRKLLYDEIWKHSATGVAKKYNLHYAKLITSLKEANIPYPSSGHWTRLGCGKDVSNEVIDLPESNIESVSLYLAGFSVSRKEKKGESEFEETQIKMDNERENVIRYGVKEDALFDDEEFPDTLLSFLDKEERIRVIDVLKEIKVKQRTNFHKKIVAYRESINTWKQWEKDQNNRGYNRYYSNGYKAEPPLFINEVSAEGLSRVMQLLDALFKAVEKLAGEINSDLSMKVRMDTVRVKFAEGQDKKEHELTKQEAKALLEYKDAQKYGKYASKPQIRKYDYFYNGKLRIIFDNGKYIRDNNQDKLEDKLDEILVQLYENSEEHRIDRERHEEAHRLYLEEKRREEEKKERLEKEQINTQSLVNKARDYQVACEIRNYISALFSKDELNEEEKEWISWAEKKADWYDPIIAREDEYLGKRRHSLPEDEKELIKKGRNSFYNW